MRITYTCPITGIKQVQNYGAGSENVNITAPHNFFGLKTSQLEHIVSGLADKASRFHKMAGSDNDLLQPLAIAFVALWHKSGKLKISHGKHFPIADLIAQQTCLLRHVKTVSVMARNKELIADMPSFCPQETTIRMEDLKTFPTVSAINNYLGMIWDCILHGSRTPSLTATTHTVDAAIPTVPRHRKIRLNRLHSLSISEAKKRITHYITNYAQENLKIGLLNFITEPEIYTIQQHNAMTAIITELLGTQAALDKCSAALEFFDYLLVKKIQLAEQLEGINSLADELSMDDMQAANKEKELRDKLLADISNTYTAISASGIRKFNTATSVGRLLESGVDLPKIGNAAPIKTIPVPTSEPKPEDYSNKFAYRIALEKWKEAKAQSQC